MPPIEEAQAINAQRIAGLRVEMAELPLDHPQLTLEIGCGHGHFLAAYAEQHPDEHCVAIDIIKERLEKAARKTDRAGLTNVSWLRASDTHFFAALPDTVRFNRRIFILFPDPWPKTRHNKRRFVQRENLDRLARVLVPGGEFRFASDIPDYVRWTLAHVRAHGGFEWLAEGPNDWRNRPADWPGTRYEAKALEAGRVPSYLTFRSLP